MNIFRKIRRYIDSLFIQKEGEEEQELQHETESERTEWRTRRYRRFYEGYTEVMVAKEGGGTRTDMIYTGKYYQADVSACRWRVLKLLYWLLWLLSAGIWGFTALLGSSANREIYVYIPQVLTLLGFMMMLRYLIERSFAPHKLIIREYRAAVKNIRLISVLLLAAEALGALTVLVALLVHLCQGAFDGRNILQLAGILLSSALLVLIVCLERRVSYTTLPNENAHIRGHRV